MLVQKIEHSQNRLPYIYVMDSIIKNVQGNYIQAFEERIVFIFVETYKKLQSQREKSTMVKLLKIWELFLDGKYIQAIK